MKIPFIYKTYHPRHSAFLFGEQIFMDSLLRDVCMKVDTSDGLEGAVVSIRGVDNWDYLEQLNEDLAKLKWCLVIVTGNEDSSDFYTHIKHPNCKIWVQTPKVSDKADSFLPIGYPVFPDSIPQIKNFQDIGDIKKRDLDWCFLGQVNSPARKQCVKESKKLKNGMLLETEGFQKGLSHSEYTDVLLRSKFALCPSAVSTTDSFRLYEALEAGCIPISDNAAYWVKVFKVPGFPTVEDWTMLPTVLNTLLPEWEKHRNVVQFWWHAVKINIVEEFNKQIKELTQ